MYYIYGGSSHVQTDNQNVRYDRHQTPVASPDFAIPGHFLRGRLVHMLRSVTWSIACRTLQRDKSGQGEGARGGGANLPICRHRAQCPCRDWACGLVYLPVGPHSPDPSSSVTTNPQGGRDGGRRQTDASSTRPGLHFFGTQPVRHQLARWAPFKCFPLPQQCRCRRNAIMDWATGRGPTDISAAAMDSRSPRLPPSCLPTSSCRTERRGGKGLCH